MVLSVWPDRSAPVLVNPTAQELVHFAETERIDTIRVCFTKTDYALGSGFGNTHTSVASLARTILGKRWFPDNIIVYKLGTEWYVNDLAEDDKVPLKRFFIRWAVNDKMLEAIKTIIELQ